MGETFTVLVVAVSIFDEKESFFRARACEESFARDAVGNILEWFLLTHKKV